MRIVFPDAPRLSFAVETAARCLLQEDLRAFPVRPLEIIRRRGWQLRTYEHLAHRYSDDATPATILALYGGAQAVTSVRREHDQPTRYLISYDHRPEPPERIAFTLAHEIGHILLGHFEYGLPDEHPLPMTHLLDAEANVFAANLLAPAVIVSRLRRPRREEDRLLFNLSKAAWQTRLDTLEQDVACFPAALAAQLEQQFAAYLYRRQCTACGAIFLYREECPACGCRNLRWSPADERSAAFPWTAESWRVSARPAACLENPMVDEACWPGEDRGL